MELSGVLALAFVLLIISWASSVYRSAGDSVATAKLVGAYLFALVSLYMPLAMRNAPPELKRRRLEAAQSAVTIIVIAGAVAKVTPFPFVPLWVFAVVWAVAAAAIACFVWDLYTYAKGV